MEQWSIVFHGWISWGRKFVTMRFSERGKGRGRTMEELKGDRESRQQQQTKEALFGAPCIPVIIEEEPACTRGGGRGTVTNETPSYSQRSFLPSLALLRT